MTGDPALIIGCDVVTDNIGRAAEQRMVNKYSIREEKDTIEVKKWRCSKSMNN